MKHTSLGIVLRCVLMLASCGTTMPRTFNGIWSARLENANAPVFEFSGVFVQSGSKVAVSKLAFDPLTPCFGNQPNANATFTSNSGGMSKDVQQTGQFAITISATGASPQGTAVQQNMITMRGSLTSNSTNEVITGVWTATGSVACSGNGTFTMTPAGVDPVP